jgi:ribonuclease R
MRQPEVLSKNFVGVIPEDGGALAIKPCSKKERSTVYSLNPQRLNGAKPGDVVLAERPAGGSHDAKILQVLGNKTTPGIFSTISLYEAGLSEKFSEAASKQAQGLTVPELGDREDLRDIPLVTVDGPDSRDFDDAIYAEDLPDGGKHLIVAIADVSFYVRPGDAIDQEAYKRGNSTYLPDRAVPMIPRELSNGLCSLNPHEDRACMVYHLYVDKDGNLVDKKINRGLMRSAARLTYEQLQAAKDGKPDATTAPLMDNVVNPLYEAYDILKAAAGKRGMLELGSNEYKTKVDADGKALHMVKEGDEASHDVIAQFMILANIAGDMTLNEARVAAIHRYHAAPPEHKLKALSDFLGTVGLSLPPGANTDDQETFRKIIEQAEKLPDGGESVKVAISMAQSKAIYDSALDGHFGLALPAYGHHTSPIRRYADLMNHRALVTALGLGEGGLNDDQLERIQEIAEHITETEIKSDRAERAADDRYAADVVSRRIGEEFNGRVTGVIGNGFFVRLEDEGVEGAQGMVPVRTLNDFYNFDPAAKTLTGSKKKKVYKSGDKISVRVKDADSLAGSITLTATNDNKPDGKFRPQQGSRPQQKRKGPRPGKGYTNICSWPTR